MGIVKSTKNFFKGGDKGPKQEVKSPEPKTPEVKKPSADVGRELVQSLKTGAENLWSNLKGRAETAKSALFTKAKDGLDMIMGTARTGAGMAVEGAFTAVGKSAEGAKAVKKGVETAAAATVSGVESAVKYTKESGQEILDLGKAALEAAKTGAERTKDAVTKAGLAGGALAYATGKEGVRLVKDLKDKGIELGSELGKKTIEKASDLSEMGLDGAKAVKKYGGDRIQDVKDAAEAAKKGGIDLSKKGADLLVDGIIEAVGAGIDIVLAVEKAKTDTATKTAEIMGNARAGIDNLKTAAREKRDNFFKTVTTGRDNFFKKVKAMIIEAMSPELDELIEKRAQELMSDRDKLSEGDIEYEEDTSVEESEVAEA